MGQLRSLKLSLESRLGAPVGNELAIMEWMTEHSRTTINRAQVGHDGKTPYRRLMGKEASQPLVEFGEQVLAKPLRQKKTSKKISLATRWLHGTWVGITNRSNENLVVLPDGGPAIRVRTIVRRPVSERWDHQAIAAIKATPSQPNPKDKGQRTVEPESSTTGASVEGDQ